MKRRPDQASDCPGCNVGWVIGDLLCPRCADKVQNAQPDFYPQWLKSRAAAVHGDKTDTVSAALEAYHRGLIVGTAILLHKPGPARTKLRHTGLNKVGAEFVVTAKI